MSDIATNTPIKFCALMVEKNGQGGCLVGPFKDREMAGDWLDALVEKHPHIGLDQQNHTLLGVAQLVTPEEFAEAAAKVASKNKKTPNRGGEPIH